MGGQVETEQTGSRNGNHLAWKAAERCFPPTGLDQSSESVSHQAPQALPSSTGQPAAPHNAEACPLRAGPTSCSVPGHRPQDPVTGNTHARRLAGVAVTERPPRNQVVSSVQEAALQCFSLIVSLSLPLSEITFQEPTHTHKHAQGSMAKSIYSEIKQIESNQSHPHLLPLSYVINK